MTDSDLIARLEAAPEGSRELDYDVGRAAHPDYDFWIGAAIPALLEPAKMMMRLRGTPVATHVALPAYTTSVDASKSLEPEGCAMRLEYVPAGTWPYRVWLFRDQILPLCDERGCPALGKTEALARCIAALRARKETR